MARKNIEEKLAKARRQRQALDARIKQIEAAERRRKADLEKSARGVIGRWLIDRAKKEDENALSVLRDAMASGLKERDEVVLLELFPGVRSEGKAKAIEEQEVSENLGREDMGTGDVGQSVASDGGSQGEVKEKPFGSRIGNRAE